MLMIDKHKFEQNYNNFGYLSTKFWLKGNDTSPPQLSTRRQPSINVPSEKMFILSTLKLQIKVNDLHLNAEENKIGPDQLF